MAILLIVLGTLLGIVMGALPGIGPTLTLALLLPFTYGMNPVLSVSMMAGAYCGSVYGGSISSILINTPGTPGSIATCFDGYPLAQKGEANRALVVAAVASFIGGIASLIFLAAFSPLLSKITLLFSSADYFVVAILGLSLVAIAARGNYIFQHV